MTKRHIERSKPFLLRREVWGEVWGVLWALTMNDTVYLATVELAEDPVVNITAEGLILDALRERAGVAFPLTRTV